MYQGSAQAYIQANFLPPGTENVDWRHKPDQFKLYKEGVKIPLPYLVPREHGQGIFELANVGELLADLYGLTQQRYVFPDPLSAWSVSVAQPAKFSPMLRRAVPSGGALFPGEIYLFVSHRDDLPAGIYHYDAAHHALDLLQSGDLLDTANSLLAQPDQSAGVCMIALSCFFWKNGFKYGEFSYRLQGFDLGTLIAQGLALVKQRALTATVHYQFLDENINNMLGLDTLQESIYALITLNEQKPEERKPDSQKLRSMTIPVVGTMPRAAELPSVALWPLVEATHRAACIDTHERLHDLHDFSPIAAPVSRFGYPLPTATSDLDLLSHYQQRHSAGHFLPRPISLSQLSQLCHAGLVGYPNDIDGTSSMLQHTLLYCVINRVEEIPPGIYVYDGRKHSCELVTPSAMHEELQAVQNSWLPMISNLSVCFFAVGNYAAGFQAYGDRWYRIQNMEAGILVQRLYLMAAALQLGCRASLGFRIPSARRLLSLPEEMDVLIQVMVGPEPPQYAYYQQSLRYQLISDEGEGTACKMTEKDAGQKISQASESALNI